MSYYQKHIFICTNQKAPGKQCCANSGGEPFFDYMKSKLVQLDLHGPSKIRLSKTGCLGRCSFGPCMVIYPDDIWYTYSTFKDIDRIIQEHLIQNEPVKSLIIADEHAFLN